MHLNGNNVTYLNKFGVEHIPREIKRFINESTVTTNIFRIQAYDSVMYGYFCIEFIDFMIKSKSLIDFTRLFSSNFKNNDKIILKHAENR